MPGAPDSTSGTTQPEASEAPVDLTGRTLGDFQLLRRLGIGGMGQVYLARQLSLKRQVAIKLLRHDLSANATALKRFEAEAHAVAKLNHPNIVQVYALGETEGLRYMALEFVEGRNLRDHLARRGPPDLPVALSIMRQVATALLKAHDQGLVHRDIKPENILVTKKVEVKVTDFGLSRFLAGGEEAVSLTQSGVTLGTPLYLSPEQAQGRPVDHRSDIYSFGVTCYHLLAGEPPFRGSTAVEVALKHVTDQPQPLAEQRPDLPPDLSAMVHKMMAKSPEDRYQSVRDILRDLAKIKEGLSLGLTESVNLAVSGPPEGLAAGIPASQAATSSMTASGFVPAAPRRPPAWGRWLLAAVLVIVATAGGVFAFLWMQSGPSTPAHEPTVGLPDIRPSGKLQTTRERELIDVLESRGTKGEDIVAASIELGLLYVRERRLDEAQARFEALEREHLGAPLATESAIISARFGKAIVMAYRDSGPQFPQTAKESLKLFAAAVNSPIPKDVPGASGKPAGKAERIQLVQRFLLRYPELAQAVAEALNRNAVNLGATRIANLEPLRHPRSGPKKEDP